MTLVLERLFDVAAILCLYFLGALAVSPFPETFQFGAEVAGAFLALAAGGVALLLWQPRFCFWLWRRVGVFLPAPLFRKGQAALEDVAHSLSSLKSIVQVTLMMGYSLLKWLCSGVLIWIALMAYGANVSLGVCLIASAVGALAVTVPSTPGYIGLVQAAFVFVLVPFGVTQEVAFAASVFFWSFSGSRLPRSASSASFPPGCGWRRLEKMWNAQRRPAWPPLAPNP